MDNSHIERALAMLTRQLNQALDQNARIIKQLAEQDTELSQLRRAVFGFAYDEELDALFSREIDDWRASEAVPTRKSDIEEALELRNAHRGSPLVKTTREAIFAPAPTLKPTKPQNEGYGVDNVA